MCVKSSSGDGRSEAGVLILRILLPALQSVLGTSIHKPNVEVPRAGRRVGNTGLAPKNTPRLASVFNTFQAQLQETPQVQPALNGYPEGP